MAKKKKFVDIQNAGDRLAYTDVLKKITQDGVCPFCRKYFTYHTRPILRQGRNWLVTENMNPYTGTRHHFLFVHKKHIESAENISPKAWQELGSHVKWVSKKYKLPAGSFFMRFGDMRYTSSSVVHLHAQLVSGVPRGKKTFLITPGIGYGRKK